MGHLASKVRGDSPRLPSCHPWSKAPCGSWVIRFSPAGPFTQKLNKVAEIKGLPLYHWPSPDWVTGDAFNTLMFVVVQIFLEGNHNRLMRLMEEPLEAAEMIAQFNTFITSTNQDMKELQNQLFEAAYESIYLHVEDDKLRYLDLLITNAFDPQYQLRAVLSRKSRSSKSSLLHSVSSKIKSKLVHLKNKGRQRSRSTPAQPSIPVSSHTPPLRPTAPGLSEFIERTETVTINDGVDNTNEVPVVVISDNSNINGTKDADRESYEAESSNDESTRKSEEKSVNLESNMSSSYHFLPSTSDIVAPQSEVVSSEQSPDELIAKQRSVGCTEVSPEGSSDTYSSFTGVAENEPLLPPKVSSENEKNAGYSSCLQKDTSEDADIHVSRAGGEEPDCSNNGQFYGDVPSGTLFTVESVEHNEEDGPVCCDVSADSSEYNKYNDPPSTDVPSGSRYVDSNDNNNIHNGLACIDGPSGFKKSELDEHSEDNDTPCTDISPGSKYAYSFEPNKYNDPACTDVPSGSGYGESSEHSNDIGSRINVSNVPTASSAHSDLKYAEPSEHIKDDGPTCSDVHSGSEQDDSNENSHSNAPINAESHPGPIHEESNLEKQNNGPVHEEVSPGTSQHHNSKEPMNAIAPKEKQLSNHCTFLPIYGLSKHCLRSTTSQVSTAAQELLSDIKEGKEKHSVEPQMHQPSSSSFSCLPFHGLSRGSFSPHQGGASTGVQTRKRKAGNEADSLKLENKILKLGDSICEARGEGEESDPCDSTAEGADTHSDTEKPIPRGTAKQVSTAAQGKCANVKEEHGTKPQVQQPSPSSFGFLPFHGLSRGSFNPPWQGASTGVQTRKRQANIDEPNGTEPVAKRLKADESCKTEGNSDPCHSSPGDSQLVNETELNQTCDTADHDAESVGEDDSNSSESIEWHDALEDIES